MTDDSLETPYGQTPTVDLEAQRRVERDKQDWRDVVATEGGRRVLWSILRMAGLFEPYADQGRVALAIDIRASIMRLSPHYWHQMVKENDT